MESNEILTHSTVINFLNIFIDVLQLTGRSTTWYSIQLRYCASKTDALRFEDKYTTL